MTQRNLFDDPLRAPLSTPRARARRTDVGTSHEAATKVEKIGKAERQRRMILDYLQQHRGQAFTTAELGERIDGVDRYDAGRRTPEVGEAGHIVREKARVCRVTGNRAKPWRAR